MTKKQRAIIKTKNNKKRNSIKLAMKKQKMMEQF